jgi:hypothetical protein
MFYFVASGLFSNKHFFIQQPPATIFYSLPMIAENAIKLLPQFISSTFTVIFFLLPLKNQEWKWDAILTIFRGSGRPTE